jgi:hypothetical protein
MIVNWSFPVLLALTACAVAVAGCESTQAKSARIIESLGPVKEEKGLEIDEESKDVEVLDTSLFTDKNGTAVVVQVKNESSETLVDIPIAINVLDAKGKSVYKNNIPGLEPALAAIPMLEPGETLDWVNNQVLPIGEPKEVEVEIGDDASKLEAEVPDVEVGEPELEQDPVSGINAAGSAINHTDERLERLLIYGVARVDGEIVAAGRAALENMNPERERVYHIYFIGDPEGADVSISSFPTLEPATDSKGGSNG